MTTTTTLFARVLERRQHQHQHHQRRTRRRICSSSSTKKSFSIKSHKVVSTQNNNNNNEEEEIKTTSRRRGREDGKCSFSRLASTTAVCFAASMTVATSTVILPVGGNTDFFSARADEQVEKCTKTVRENMLSNFCARECLCTFCFHPFAVLHRHSPLVVLLLPI